MTDGDKNQQPALQVEAARKAFEQEFERFARFTLGAPASTNLALDEAETEQRALNELRTRHLGKKSALAACKKMIGSVAPAARAAFGQLVQQTESLIVQKLEGAAATLKNFIEASRIEREILDVTLPGRRPRRGHLHPITLLRERIEDIFVSLGYAI